MTTKLTNPAASDAGRPAWASGIKPASASWAAGLTPSAAMFAGVKVHLDDVPTFDAHADPEVDVHRQLAGDRAMIRQPPRRLFVDYRSNPDALKHLEQMPNEGESLHGVICGRYALWEMVPALIERTGQDIAELFVATLSYGAKNAADLLALIDEGRIGSVTMLVSCYFKKTNQGLYDTLVPPLRERGHRVLAMRTHAKLLLLKMADGSRYVVEASANLRSCKNIEQFCLSRDEGLHRFYHHVLDGELMRPRKREEVDG